MMRALYTSATGMIAQQFHMDVVSNNLANVNTVGFKKSRPTSRTFSTRPCAPPAPRCRGRAGARAPRGRPGRARRCHAHHLHAGSFQQTGNPLDVAIEGDGFFKVQTPGGAALHPRRRVQD
jgi:flagellar basal-body rod protein FlgG